MHTPAVETSTSIASNNENGEEMEAPEITHSTDVTREGLTGLNDTSPKYKVIIIGGMALVNAIPKDRKKPKATLVFHPSLLHTVKKRRTPYSCYTPFQLLHRGQKPTATLVFHPPWLHTVKKRLTLYSCCTPFQLLHRGQKPRATLVFHPSWLHTFKKRRTP